MNIYLSGLRYEFLPPYSPDFNPIELTFSAMKAHIRRHRELFYAWVDDYEESSNDGNLVYFLYEAVYSATASDARGWYHKCGYI